MKPCVSLAGWFPGRMVKLVLLHRDDSIYGDREGEVYDFPKSYLKAVAEGVGDWVIYYEPVKAGPRGYYAIAKIEKIVPHAVLPDRFLAVMERQSFLPFDQEVPRLVDGRPLEAALRNEDGTPKTGGAQQLAVRRLSEADFARILSFGLPPDLEADEARRYDTASAGLADEARAFERPVVERLVSRPYRDVAFRRKVRAAYDFRCAISGLRLRNGGGRPEVNSAHIIPVEKRGSDSVTNGLALSGTLHWMFDRGLVAIAEDHTILVSGNKVPADVVNRLIVPDRKLVLPGSRRDWPHPANLRWHRQNVFGQVSLDGPSPWD